MKKVMIGLSVVVVLAVAGGYFIWSNLGALIKESIETAGSEVTEVTVSVDEVDVERLTDGVAALRGLSVGNPKGFKTDSAFELGTVSVKLDATTVVDDVVIIKEVVIEKPRVIYEFGSGGSNIATIQKAVQRNTGGGSSGGAAKSSGKDGGSAKKFVIENLYIRNGAIDVSAKFLGGKKVGTPLPTIHLKNIGKKGGKNTGATPAEVAEKVIGSIGKFATSAVGKINIGSIKDALGGQLSGAASTVKESLSGSALQKGAEDAGKSLKGLFGK